MRRLLVLGLVVTSLSALLATGAFESAPPAPLGPLAPLDSAPAAEPLDAGAWIARSRACADKRDLDGAIACATKAIDLQPGCVYAWVFRGWAHGEKRELAAEILDETRAIELSPTDAAAWRLRQGARRENGDLEGARSDLTRLLELQPNDAQAWIERAAARGDAGDLAGRAADATRATELEPKNGYAWFLRATAKLAVGDESALEDVRRATELMPANPWWWRLRATLEGRPARRSACLAELDRIVEREPGNASAYRGRAWARAETGDFAAAIADTTKAIELDGRDANAYKLRAWAREETGDSPGASRDRELAGRLAPGSAALTRPPRLSSEERSQERASWARTMSAARVEAVACARRALDDGGTAAVASAVETCFQLGQVDVARESLLGRAQVVEWTASAELVSLEAHYRSQGHGELEIAITRRRGASGPLAVAFPPGSWVEGPSGPWADQGGGGEPRPKSWTWPKPQDLALVRAPVVFLAGGQSSTIVRVPVACANFGGSQPCDSMPYQLRAAESGSPTERLLTVACTGARMPAASQLAIWVVRNGMGWRHFMASTEGQAGSFSSETLDLEKVPAAERLLERASIATGSLEFFREIEGPVRPPESDPTSAP